MTDNAPVEVDVDDANEDTDTTNQAEQTQSTRSSRQSDIEDSAGSIKSLPFDDIEEIFENGRRYANESYFLPNDEAEEIRSSIMHQTYLAALSGYLTFHRIRSNIASILDIGAGSGDWAIAMAESYPDCAVIATDIWPFQPAGIPPNLMYEIDDARLEWDFLEKFDYIHVRGLAGAFQDWSIVYKQMYDACSDDGTLEVADLSLVRYGIAKSNTALERYNDALNQGATSVGVSLNIDHLREQTLQESGFRIFRKVSIDIPVGLWNSDPAKESLGKLALVTVLEGLEAQSMRLLTHCLNWTAEEVTTLCEEVKDEIMKANLQPTMTCHIVVAKKIPNIE